MSWLQEAAREAAKTARYILVRNVPVTCTSGDVRRALIQADIKGVAEVDLLYSHFRPTGKALLTMSAADYTPDATRSLDGLNVAGSCVGGEAIYNLWSTKVQGKSSLGDGPSAGLQASKAVTMSGLHGRMSISEMYKLLKGFDVQKITAVSLPEKKFSLYSRFTVQVETESEAYRIVRKFHMTEFHKTESGPPIRAEIIY